MADDSVKHKLDFVCAAASKVVADMFNATTPAFRPVALAAIRLSVESAVATMSESDRALYVQAIGHMQMTAVKIPRKP